MSNLLSAAYKYIENGICVIPTNGEKKAFIRWKEFQDRMITKEEAKEQFSHRSAEYLAIVCGKSSGNLEVIDIDCKYDLTGTLYSDFTQMIMDNIDGLFPRLKIIQTRSKGYHLYYRCPNIGGNNKLANRYTTDGERKDKDDKIRVLIETRGLKGYVIAPPSKDYKTISDTKLPIPLISPEEREMLFELAGYFNQVVAPPIKNNIVHGYNPKEYGLSPFEAYNNSNNVVSLLQEHNWKLLTDDGHKAVFLRPGKDKGSSGNFNYDKKWFSVFTTSSIFESQKAYLPYAVYAILKCEGDFKRCAKELLTAGYGQKREYYSDKLERDAYKKKREGMSREQLVDYIKTDHEKFSNSAEKIVDQLEAQWGEKVCTFWDVDDKLKLSINRGKLIEFLFSVGGFSLYYYDANSTIFKIVRCVNGFLEEVSSEHIKKFLKQYIENLPDTFDGGITSADLMELVLKGADTFFSKGLLEFLTRGQFDFLKDSQFEAFFPFRNGIVKVTQDDISIVGYNDVNKVIWKSQVIDYDIYICKDLDKQNIEYADFLNCVSGDDPDRFNYACTLIGYLLHKYKDFSRPYAVVLAEENDNENEGGGTGKGIFITALSKFLKTERIDGKNFKLDKNFAFQRVSLDTRLVAIEDCRKNVDFEGFYSIITEGVTVEKKNKDELFIPYKDSAKIMFTTNYTITTQGNHARRRQRVFEFANFFNATKTPDQYFGHNLFDEWDGDEWIRFYNLGFVCVKEYLANGIMMVAATEKIKRKHLRLKYSPEFLEWWDEYCSNGRTEWKMAADLYASFVNEYDLEKKDYPQTKFGRALSEAAETLSLKIERSKNRQSGNKVQIRVVDDSEKNK